jgi:putative IMPACT (imprinted ancient) family translation regulator
MTVYSNADHNLVIAWQATLEKELHSVLENGEEYNLFKDPVDGIWFGGILRNKGGKILSHRTRNGSCNQNRLYAPIPSQKTAANKYIGYPDQQRKHPPNPS